MICNDLSGEEEEEKSSFIEDEELEGSTDLFAELGDLISSLMMMILMISDISLKHPTTE